MCSWAELWGVILALQANDGVHLGVDNLGVVRHVGRILDGWASSRPCELLPDGDLLLLIERMLHLRGFNTARISKVKGHADEALVRAGAVRGSDKLGNDRADEAADFGRRRVPWWVVDARRIFSGVCSRWRPMSLYCIVSLLLFLGLWLIMMVVLVLVPILMSGRLEVLLRSDGLRCGIGLFLPGPSGLWVGSGVAVAATPTTCRDIEVWPYSVGMLVKWVAFLHSLHWLADGCSLGVGGVSYVALLILYEIWAGERLELEKAVPRCRRPGRSISVSAVPFGPGTDIWRSCRFIGALFRGLQDLPFGLRRLFLV